MRATALARISDLTSKRSKLSLLRLPRKMRHPGTPLVVRRTPPDG